MRTTIYLLMIIASLCLISAKPGGDLKLNWERVTDKDYVVSYVTVQYDSTSQYAIDNHFKIYSTNDGVKLFSKASVKLIKELVVGAESFTSENPDEVCAKNYFPKAIVVTRLGEVQGIINIGCNERVWYFEPKSKHGEVKVLSEKGKALQEQILSTLK